jgi:hypothetical protein
MLTIYVEFAIIREKTALTVVSNTYIFKNNKNGNMRFQAYVTRRLSSSIMDMLNLILSNEFPKAIFLEYFVIFIFV